MIDGFKKSGKWKIHLTIKINFASITGPIEKRLMHFKRDNIEITTQNLDYHVESRESIMMTVIVCIVFIHSEKKANLNRMKLCVRIIIIVT